MSMPFVLSCAFSISNWLFSDGLVSAQSLDDCGAFGLWCFLLHQSLCYFQQGVRVTLTPSPHIHPHPMSCCNLLPRLSQPLRFSRCNRKDYGADKSQELMVSCTGVFFSVAIRVTECLTVGGWALPASEVHTGAVQICTVEQVGHLPCY